jgi:YgiT-type zinc finger domain-containing protein
MSRVICKNGETQLGTATVTLEREGATVVIKGVPARVCRNCGEEYMDEGVTARLLKTAEEVVRAGVGVDLRPYEAASASPARSVSSVFIPFLPQPYTIPHWLSVNLVSALFPAPGNVCGPSKLEN